MRANIIKFLQTIRNWCKKSKNSSKYAFIYIIKT